MRSHTRSSVCNSLTRSFKMWWLTLLLFGGLEFQNLVKGQVVYNGEILPLPNRCVSAISSCVNLRKPIATNLHGDTFFEKSEDLEEACSQQGPFVACVENAALSCTAQEEIEIVMLKNRLFLKDLCASNSNWKKEYLKKAPCINKYVRKASIKCSWNLGSAPKSGIGNGCRYLEELVPCKSEILKLKCGEPAGDLFSRIMVLNDGKEFLCSVYKPLEKNNLSIEMETSLLYAINHISSYLNQTDKELKNVVKDLAKDEDVNPILDLGHKILYSEGTSANDNKNLEVDTNHYEFPSQNFDNPPSSTDSFEKSHGLTINSKTLYGYFEPLNFQMDSSFKSNAFICVFEIIGNKLIIRATGETMVDWRTIKNVPLMNILCDWFRASDFTRLFDCRITIGELSLPNSRRKLYQDPIFLVLYDSQKKYDEFGRLHISELAKFRLENYNFPENFIEENIEPSILPKSALMGYMHEGEIFDGIYDGIYDDVHRLGETWMESHEIEKNIFTGTDKADFGLKETDSLSGATLELFYDSIEEAAREVPSKDDLSFYVSLSYIALKEYERKDFHLRASISTNGAIPDLFYDDAIEKDDKEYPLAGDLKFFASLSSMASKEYERRFLNNRRNADYNWVDLISESDKNVEEYKSSIEPLLDTSQDAKIPHEFDIPKTTPDTFTTIRHWPLDELDITKTTPDTDELDIPKTTPYTFTTIRHWSHENEDSESPYYPGSVTSDLEIHESSTKPQDSEDDSSLPQSDCPKTSSSITTVGDHFQNERSDFSDEFKQNVKRVLGTVIKPDVYIDWKSMETIREHSDISDEFKQNVQRILGTEAKPDVYIDWKRMKTIWEHSDFSDEFKQSVQRILGTEAKPDVYIDWKRMKTIWEQSDFSDEFKQSVQRILGTDVKPGEYIDLRSIGTIDRFQGLDLEERFGTSSFNEEMKFIIAARPYLIDNIKHLVNSEKPKTLMITHVTPSAKIVSDAIELSEASELLENRIGHIYIE